MGKIRNGSATGFVKNEEHLKELCEIMMSPNLSIKQLNTLYAIRSSWSARGYLLDRELVLMRTNAQGAYISKAEKREVERNRVATMISRMMQETSSSLPIVANISETVESPEERSLSQMSHSDSSESKITRRGSK